MAKARLLLKTALKETSRLRGLVQTGAAAMKAPHLKLIAEDQRKRIGDSLDLDEASREEHPESNRWDYIVSIPDLEKLIGIEPHSAKDSEIDVLVKKKAHAVQYLRGHLRDGKRVAAWYWVTEGTIRFYSKMDKRERSLAQNGIAFKGRQIVMFD